MITQNCVTFGSLVHRAQGYKKLREEMASRPYNSEPTLKNRPYFLVSETHKVYSKRNHSSVILAKGSLIKFINATRRSADEWEIKVIDTLKRCNEDVTYRCHPDKLISLDEKVCNLIGAIQSYDERVRIVKDPNLCKELCSIEVGCAVKVKSDYMGIVTSKKTLQRDGMGVVFEIAIQECLEKKSSLKKPGSTLEVTPESLRLLSDNQPFIHYLNDGKWKEFSVDNDKDSHNIKPGDKVMWCLTEYPISGTVCWNSRISDSARLHLETKCKEVNCERSETVSAKTKDLMLEEEFLKLSEKAESYNRRSEDMNFSNDSNTADLLGLNEEYNANFSKSPLECIGMY